MAPGTQQKWKLPLTASKQKAAKKQGTMRIATWNSFGLSGERMEYLCGSEDGSKAGLFPARGEHWILCLQECRFYTKTLADTGWRTRRRARPT